LKKREQLRNLLVLRGLAHDPDEAERLVLAAQVSVEGVTITRAGELVPTEALIEVKPNRRYVSRGGFKLEAALDDFSIDPTGLNCIDVGASSGGFSDCLLQRGALKVCAVDVGYGQFDWKLREDGRVSLFERTNIAKADPVSLGAPFDLLVADLSFTSLARLASQLVRFVGDEGKLLTLVKPQFELPKDLVEDGVIRSLDLHVKALEAVVSAYLDEGLAIRGLSHSRLLGAKGNREFWIWAAKNGVTATIDIVSVIQQAHREL